jgi:hypothetical protein
VWSPKEFDFSFFDFSVIFQSFSRNNLKRKGQNHRYGSKTTIRCSKTAFETALEG